MRTTITAGVTAIAVAGAVLVTAPAAEAAGRGTTKLHGTKTHAVSIAHSLRPGVVHLRNTGKTPVIIARKKKAGAATFAKLFNATSSSAERKALKAFDVIEIAMPKSDSWVKLRKGTYFLADGGGKKITASKVRTVMVEGHTRNAVPPRAVRLSFDAKGHLPAATAVKPKTALRLVNHNKKLAFALTLEVKPTLTDAQLAEIVAHPTEDNVFEAASDDYGLDLLPAAVGPKHSATVATMLGAGRYLLLTGSGDTVRRGDVGLLTVR